jgi:hypothetical protein
MVNTLPGRCHFDKGANHALDGVTQMKSRIATVSVAIFLGSLGPANGVLAETVDCTPIPSLPYTISQQGIYCFDRDLSTSISAGNAINILVNNVTIDLNGWKLGGLAAGASTDASGIFANGRSNVTIKNGTIRGFLYGIEILAGQGHLIEGIRAERNTAIGISVSSDGSIIRNNQVVDTGGSTIAADSFGIRITSDGVRVLNNDVMGVASTGNAYGIFAFGTTNTVIENNRISGTESSGTGTSAGITVGFAQAMVVGNRIYGTGDYGIFFPLGGGGYLNNTVSGGASTPYHTGGAGDDLGGNTSSGL